MLLTSTTENIKSYCVIDRLVLSESYDINKPGVDTDIQTTEYL